MLFKEFEDVFTWTYKDLKCILLKLVQHRIESETSIPLTRQARYKFSFNYAMMVKQNIVKLLVARFIQLMLRIQAQLIKFH
jgi:hypothetical protein